MKTHSAPGLALRLAGSVLAALAVAGCLKERLAWSPDGKHAAILTADGLHLSDATGRISPLLAPTAYRVAWLPDSQRLVIARRKAAKNFAEVAAALGPARAAALAAKAESVWGKLRELPRSEAFDQRVGDEIGADLVGILAYLREQPNHLATLRAKLGNDWKPEDETKPVDLHEVVVARLKGEGLEFGPTLHVGLPEIQSLRPAPGGQAVAFALPVELSPYPDHGLCLLLAPADGSAAAEVVATQSTSDPDWARDGRSLVFFQASGTARQSDEPRFGTLAQREVLDVAGRIHLADHSSELASLVFHPRNRVRCLRDGRVVFNASPMTLPTSGQSGDGHEQLFARSRDGQADLVPLIPPTQLDRLPKLLSTFEVSPDDTQVLFGSDKGGVWLFTLASGAVEQVTANLDDGKVEGEGENYPAPAWRAPGEFTFLRRAARAAAPAGSPGFELVLRRGPNDVVLSQTWAPTLLRRLIE